jgi:heat shock protein HslJ
MARIFSILVVILVVSCSSTKQQTPVFPYGEWKLQSLNSSDVSTLTKPIVIRLDTLEKRVSGFAGCNQFFGTYSANNNAITFSGIGSTKMFCDAPQQTENDFLKALQEVGSFQTDGKTLTFYKGESMPLQFVKNN